MWEGQNLDGLLENAAQRVGNEPGSVHLPESLYGAAYRPRDTWMRPPGSRSTPRQRSAAASAAPFAAAPRVSQSQTASPDPAASLLPRAGATAAAGGVTARGGTGTRTAPGDPAGGRQAGLRIPQCLTEGRPPGPSQAGSARPSAGAPASPGSARRVLYVLLRSLRLLTTHKLR